MNALIVTNAYSRNSSQFSQAERMAEELSLLGEDVRVERNVRLAGIHGGEIMGRRPDYCVFLDKDKAAARLLEGMGVRLFNSAGAIELCDSKMLTHIALAGKGIPMPDTEYAPLCYTEGAAPDDGFLDGVEEALGYPMVAKMCHGSLGTGVFLVSSRDELEDFERRHARDEHLYQRYIECVCGTDIRAIALGGKFLCAYRRVNENDFRSNIELGGRGERIDVPDEARDLCERVSRALGADYCGVDVLISSDGRYYVCEANSNAFFATAEKICGVNIARAYAEYVTGKMRAGRESGPGDRGGFQAGRDL